MPRSTSSAVRMPLRARPSSTSVIATAGRMPTTTVSASSTRDTAPIVASHPADELVDDLQPGDVDDARRGRRSRRSARPGPPGARARAVLEVDLDRDQQHVADASGSGTRSISVPDRAARRTTSNPALAQRQQQRVGQARLGLRCRRTRSRARRRLGDLRPDAGDDAVGADQPSRRHRLQQVLGDLGVDRRQPGDVDDRERRTGVDQRLQEPSITTWVRAESSVPTSGTATTPSHSFTTGVDSSSSWPACSAMTLSRAVRRSRA